MFFFFFFLFFFFFFKSWLLSNEVAFTSVTVYSHFNIVDHLSLSVISWLLLVSFVIIVVLNLVKLCSSKSDDVTSISISI